jgi:hypothetical protein
MKAYLFIAFWLIVVAVVVYLFYTNATFRKWSQDSEVTLWAHMKIILGVILSAALSVDKTDFVAGVQTFLDKVGFADWWPFALVILGVLLYLARWIRDTFLVQTGDTKVDTTQ